MKSLELNRESLETFYNVHYSSLREHLGISMEPLDGMIGIISPGECSTPHRHHESELFIVLEGSGIFDDGNGKTENIEIGSIILSNSFDEHSLNNSGSKDLVFVSLWWNSRQAEQVSLKKRSEDKLPSKVMIVATPPTPNGNLHLGHLSGPYLAADILKRYLDSQGVQVKYVTGLDDHQSYVPLKAYKQSCTSEEILREYSKSITSTYALADIEPDLIISPGNSDNYKIYIQNYFRTLHSRGELVEKEKDAYFCSKTGDYLFEAFICGTCPHCGASSDGNACEKCGIPNNCTDLINAESKYDGSGLIKKKIKQLYLPLDKYIDRLQVFWKSTSMKPHLKSLCQKLVDGGGMDIAITHPAKWGVPSTIEGYEDQVYYVWAEMAAAFIYMSEYVDQKGDWSIMDDKNWDESAELIHCFGFDNGNFFTTLFPCLWWAHGEIKKFPDRFITNEFLCLDGKKFSTSRGHAIWGNDFFSENDSDVSRFYLALNSPESFQSNFNVDDFNRFSSETWIDGFDSDIERLNRNISEHFAGDIPAPGAWTDQQVAFYDKILKFKRDMESSYHPRDFSLFSSTHTVTKYIEVSQHFSLAEQYLFECDAFSNERRTSIQLRLTALLYLGFYISPIMPKFSKELLKCFDIPEKLLGSNIEERGLSLSNYSMFDEHYFSSRIKV